MAKQQSVKRGALPSADKEIPAQACAGILLDVIICFAPDNRQDDTNGQKNKSRYPNTAVVLFFGLCKLTRTVIGVSLLFCSAHGDKGKHNVSENESNSYERALTADEEHSRKERHQYARHEEGVCPDLEIDRRALGEKALGPDHAKGDQRLNAKANGILDELCFRFLFHGR